MTLLGEFITITIDVEVAYVQYIDERFKEARPEDTVAKIKAILEGLGIEVDERWNDSGLDNCFSLSLVAKGGIPSSNGKGVTKEFARASAYGEFIERLQGGMHFYKYQSIHRDPDMHLHAYAPDAKYMTLEELEQDGQWMDDIIEAYNNPNINRNSIVKYCQIFACADDGKILTLPFYSLFEKKYVYLPIDFVDQIYATNGCCVGNTRDEAWVHALSEIMERHANLKIFSSGAAAPKFPSEVIDRYPVVSKILKQIRESGEFDIDIFDYSMGSGFPVVSTRIINKKTHSYKVNAAADPVFEIALQRTLTELFQGKNVHNFTSSHDGTVLKSFHDFPPVKNIVNQLETGSGIYTADFFADEITCDRRAEDFADNSGKNNRQLLEYILEIFKKEKKQIYVRNFSYLGFPCYRFVIPGYSEALALKLAEPVLESAMADIVAPVFKNPLAANPQDLHLLLTYSNMIKPLSGRYCFFNRLSGVPISGDINVFLAQITRSYAAYKLKSYDNAMGYMKRAINACRDEETREYLACVNKYLELKKLGAEEEKIQAIIYKFFVKTVADKLYHYLRDGKTPYDELLLRCEPESCQNCQYRTHCCHESTKKMIKTVGSIYGDFIQGQAESEFAL